MNINDSKKAFFVVNGLRYGTAAWREHLDGLGFSGGSVVQDTKRMLIDGSYWTGNINQSLLNYYGIGLIEPPVEQETTFVIDGNLVTFFQEDESDWTWHFGDGTTGTDTDPVHEYAIHGDYYPLLTHESHADHEVGLVQIDGAVVPEVSYVATPRDPESHIVDFLASGADTYDWLIDGNIYSGQSITHTFPETATYVVDLKGTNVGGNTDLLPTALYVQLPNIAPIGGFTYQTSLLVVQFTSTVVDPDEDNLTYAWTFGDGGTSASEHPEHTYAEVGIYTTTLVATDARGGQVTHSETFEVFAVYQYGPNIVDNWEFDDSDLSMWENGPITASVVGGELYLLSETGSQARTDQIVACTIGKRYEFEITARTDISQGQVKSWTGVDSSPYSNLENTGNAHYTKVFRATSTEVLCRYYAKDTGNSLIINAVSLREIIE